ncbi:TPA: hypothetical protein ACV5UU_004760 [Klebsiella michiganensis]|nr:hypothetical protein QJQ59_25425 [Klebsiella michiganensis]
MRSIASGKFCYSMLFSRGRRTARARATVPQIADSPGKAFTPQPGEYAVTWYCCGFFPACAALSRATGPQIAGNPSRAGASRRRRDCGKC